MISRRRIVDALCLILFTTVDAWGAPPTSAQHPSKEGIDFFEKRIRPVLVHNCYECHSGDKAKAKAHLLLDSRDGWQKGGDSGAAIVPGHADDSLLIEAIRYEGLEMPPKEQLPEEVIADIVRWIEMGAPDPRAGKAANPRNKIDLAEARKFWAFQRPKAAPPPAVHDTAWPATTIDRFVRARQEKERLYPVADADRMTLIRRVTFDLTGLPPTPEAVDAFLKDPSTDAFPNVVERLLASPQFGERWGRHWLDVVRYAESSGKERNIPFRYAWRYRDYVIDSFNADKPYDRFLVEQLAGDLLPAKNAAERDKQLIATGFLVVGPKGINTKDGEQFTMDVIDDQIDVTGRAMLGMTIACARCHDHKFDPIPTTDYYALAGIFHSTETFAGVAPGKKSALDGQLLALADRSNGFKISPEQEREQADRQREISQTEHQVADLRKMLRQANRKAPNRPKGNGKGRNRPPQPPAVQVNQKVVRDKVKELQDHIDELEGEATPPSNLAMGVQDAATPTNCNVLVRGEIKDKGPEVPRGVLTVLKTPQTAHLNPRRSGRLDLAHWIAGKDNPLTARVLVNRVWEHLFGQGLVDTVDNFGALGNEPSNQELLDTLAVQFMNDKWSIKKLIRSIVLSRVYQLRSQHNADDYAIDPGNKFLWRMERRRLDAEEIRDAMLLASGQLDFERPEASPVLELANKQVRPNKESQALRKPSNVRSVYLPVLRGIVPDMLQVFDLADPSLIVGKRDVTTVPTQALFLMNNPFVLKQAEEMARRVLAEKGLDQATRIAIAYRLALSRLPTDEEKTTVARYLNGYRKALEDNDHKGNSQLAAWTSLCQTLFESGEFRYVY